MIEWTTSRYGESYDLRLAATLTLVVVRETQSRDNPSPTPYSATVFGSRLKRRFATADEAKIAAFEMARSQIEKARAALADA